MYLLAATLPLDKTVLVGLPLKMITQQYIDELTGLGFTVGRLGECQYSEGARVVLIAMEELTAARKQMLLHSTYWQGAVGAIVFDEVHLFALWEQSGFRPALAEAYDLRACFRSADVPVAVMSGTPSPWLRANVVGLFYLRQDSLHPQLPPDVHNLCLLLPRITLSVLVERGGWEADLDYGFERLGICLDSAKIQRLSDLPLVLIHAKDRQTAVDIAYEYPPFVALATRFPKFVIPIHALNSDDLRRQLVDCLRSGQTKIVVATLVRCSHSVTPIMSTDLLSRRYSMLASTRLTLATASSLALAHLVPNWAGCSFCCR